MSMPETPSVQSAEVDTEIDPESQKAADEAARKAKEKQQSGVSATKTILTSGLDTDDDQKNKKLG